MIKNKIKTLIFIISMLLMTYSSFGDGNIVRPQLTDYEEIYSSLEAPDFEYIFGIDPYQADDYERYMYSPYPLFRTGVNLVIKDKTIPPGYYLLTPRQKEGKTWILFKDNGRVICTVPVYKEGTVDKSFWERKLPRQNLNAYEKARKKTMGIIGKTFGKKNQRTPIPQSYVEFDDRGEFWDMILYYGDKKYYMLFKKG